MTSPRPLRVALVNDYEIVVRGLAAMLAQFEDLEVVDVQIGAGDLDVAVDVAVFDTYGRLGVPWDRIDALITDQRPKHVALFTFAFEHRLVTDALAAGVHGYLWKGLTSEGLADALRRIAGGEVVVSEPSPRARVSSDRYRWPFDTVGLTVRESEVLALLAQGLPNQEIAEHLYVSVETVRSHLKHIFKKLCVRTRSEATAKALLGGAFTTRVMN